MAMVVPAAVVTGMSLTWILISTDVRLAIVGSTWPPLTSMFPVSMGQMQLLGSIFQAGKLRNREVKKLLALSWSVPLLVYWVTQFFKHVSTCDPVTVDWASGLVWPFYMTLKISALAVWGCLVVCVHSYQLHMEWRREESRMSLKVFIFGGQFYTDGSSLENRVVSEIVS